MKFVREYIEPYMPLPPLDLTKETGSRTRVVGTYYYADALNRVLAKRGKLRKNSTILCDEVRLIPDPGNSHDKNAVKVLCDGELIGYISRGLAEFLQPLLPKCGAIANAEMIRIRGFYATAHLKFNVKNYCMRCMK